VDHKPAPRIMKPEQGFLSSWRHAVSPWKGSGSQWDIKTIRTKSDYSR